jgi:uncharacterized membrane protein
MGLLKGLVALFPIAYIIWWFYSLFNWVPTVTNIAWTAINLWTIIALLGFFVAGGIVLIISIVGTIVILIAAIAD